MRSPIRVALLLVMLSIGSAATVIGASPDACATLDRLIAAGRLSEAGQIASVLGPPPLCAESLADDIEARLREARSNAAALVAAAALLTDDAAKADAYKAALAFNASNADAVKGLAELAPAPPEPSPTTPPMTVALELARIGRLDDAVGQLVLAYQGNPSPLPTLSPELKTLIGPMRQAEAYERANLDEKAKEALALALIEDPEADVPPALERLEGDTLARAKSNLETFVVILAQLALILVAALVGWRLLTWIAERTSNDPVRSRKVALGDFSESAGLGLGKDVGAAIAEEWELLGKEGDGRRIEISTGPSRAVPLPTMVESKLPEIKLLADIVASLLPKPFSVSGNVLQMGPRGLGLSVNIVDPSDRMLASAEFWESEFDPEWVLPKKPEERSKPDQAGAARRLGIAAASWAAYELTDGIKSVGKPDPLRQLTGSWRSYALFRVGSLLHAARPEAARVLYARALSEDPDNPAALLNLGQIEGATPDEAGLTKRNRYDSAIARLRKARDLLRTSDDYWRSNRLWYRASYNMAVASFSNGIDRQSKSIPQLQNSLTEAAETVMAAAAALPEDATNEPDTELGRFLEMVEGAGCLVMADAMSRLRGKLPPPPGLPAAPAAPAAAFRAHLAAMSAWPRESDLLDYIKRDGVESLPSRVRYNLACYLARPRGRRIDLDRALVELRYAIEPGGLGDWPRKDPSLKRLRSERGPGFEKVLALAPNVPGTAGSPDLASIGIVGKAHALALAKESVASLEDLVRATANPVGIEQIAMRLEVLVETVHRWRNLARIASLTIKDKEVGAGVANLLDDAGVESIALLADQEAQSLSRRLKDINAATSRLPDAPSTATVASWIRAARLESRAG